MLPTVKKEVAVAFIKAAYLGAKSSTETLGKNYIRNLNK